MKTRSAPFNIYLLPLLLVPFALWIGCQTSEERKQSKEASTLRLYLESGHAESVSSGVSVYRQSPVHFNFEREPFLTEGDLQTAEVVDLPGGYGIRAQFNGHGALVLEGVTVAHRGRHIGIQSFFGEMRWLAAPVITRRISNGEMVFTPDATRDEADRIVRGLTNVVYQVKKDSFIDRD
jgi:hypothetical protein